MHRERHVRLFRNGRNQALRIPRELELDADEANTGNQYATWTPRLLEAAYNLQYSIKDPGAFAHNGKYIGQILYDSLADLASVVDVDMTGMVRPEQE